MYWFTYKKFHIRVNHPDEVFNIGEKYDLKVISVDKEKLQVGCSVKQLFQILLSILKIMN